MLSLVASPLAAPALFGESWENYKIEFNKTYAAHEEPRRFKVFTHNLALIEERNAAEGKDGATHGWTKFIDLTPEEFSARYLRSHSGPKKDIEFVPLPELAVGETATKDWTGVLTTPVKDQAQCGSCWAFSATEQIESDVQRELGEMYVLSPQQIVSCDEYDQGCNGGNTETAYKYVKQSAGIVLESEYPYTSGHGSSGQCKRKDLKHPTIDLKSFKTVGQSSNGKAGVESAMAKYVGSTGPLSICVDASSWQTYRGGVMKSCGQNIDHCVQAVGIDTGAGTWKVPSSCSCPSFNPRTCPNPPLHHAPSPSGAQLLEYQLGRGRVYPPQVWQGRVRPYQRSDVGHRD